MKIISELFNIFLPQRCLVCNAAGGGSLCRLCQQLELIDLTQPRCARCFNFHTGVKSICQNCEHLGLPWQSLRYLSVYEGNTRDLISVMKYKPSFFLAEALRNLIEEKVPIIYPDKTWDMVLPMPISAQSLKERGFNQAEILTEAFTDNLVNFIQNNKRERQSQLQGLARFKNTKGAFKCRRKLSGLRILLVDDVLTSGASAYYTTLELYRAGAQAVHLFTFAKSQSFERYRIYLHKLRNKDLLATDRSQ